MWSGLIHSNDPDKMSEPIHRYNAQAKRSF